MTEDLVVEIADLDCPEVDPGADQRMHEPHNWLDLDGGRWHCKGYDGS